MINQIESSEYNCNPPLRWFGWFNFPKKKNYYYFPCFLFSFFYKAEGHGCNLENNTL